MSEFNNSNQNDISDTTDTNIMNNPLQQENMDDQITREFNEELSKQKGFFEKLITTNPENKIKHNDARIERAKQELLVLNSSPDKRSDKINFIIRTKKSEKNTNNI